MRKKTIVIDMDDTITSGTLTEIINEYLGMNAKDVKEDLNAIPSTQINN